MHTCRTNMPVAQDRRARLSTVPWLTASVEKAKNQAMIRAAVVASLTLAACGRSQGVADEDLGGLVIAPKPQTEPIDLGRAAKDAAELGRALMQPEHMVAAALGAHTVAISTWNAVTEGKTVVSSL